MTHGIDRERQIAREVQGKTEAAEAFLLNALSALQDASELASSRWGHLTTGTSPKVVAVLNKSRDRCGRLTNDVAWVKGVVTSYQETLGS